MANLHVIELCAPQRPRFAIMPMNSRMGES